jgi:hypothetical protein
MAKRQQSRSKRTAPRKVNVEQLKKTLKGWESPEPFKVDASVTSMRDELGAMHRALADRLEPTIAESLEMQKARALLAEAERKRAQLLKRELTQTKNALAASVRGQSQQRVLPRGGLAALAGPGLVIPTTVTLAPILIWATNPSDILRATHSDPVGYNSAQIYLSRDSGGSAGKPLTLTFWYSWENPTDYDAVVNARCHAVYDGVCTATADSGVLSGGWSWASGETWVIPITWWDPHPVDLFASYAQQHQRVFGIRAEGGGFANWAGGIDAQVLFSFGTTPWYSSLVIPPRATAIFKVDTVFTFGIDDGWLEFDFGSKSEFSIASLFWLEILTPPVRTPTVFG